MSEEGPRGLSVGGCLAALRYSSLDLLRINPSHYGMEKHNVLL